MSIVGLTYTVLDGIEIDFVFPLVSSCCYSLFLISKNLTKLDSHNPRVGTHCLLAYISKTCKTYYWYM